MKLVKLKFKSPLHIGIGKPDYLAQSETLLHSDTIKAAIFLSAKSIMPEINEAFWKSFVVSSAMPFWRDKIFFPKPNFSNIDFDIDDGKSTESSLGLKYAKIIKKVKFIEKSLFEKLNEGQKVKIKQYQFKGELLWDSETVEEFSKSQMDNQLRKKIDEYQDLSLKYNIIIEKSSNLKVYEKSIQERVRIYELPVIENDELIRARPYSMERIFFEKDCGLCFFIEYLNDYADIEKIIRNSLDNLKDIGFGSDKSVGNGQFEWEIEDFSIQIPKEYTYIMNLSLYLPESIEEFKQSYFRYQLLERGGYIESNNQSLGFLKNTIVMVTEGSVFKKMQEFGDSSIIIKGKYVDLNPGPVNFDGIIKQINHPVWRDGRSIFIPINFNLKNS